MLSLYFSPHATALSHCSSRLSRCLALSLSLSPTPALPPSLTRSPSHSFSLSKLRTYWRARCKSERRRIPQKCRDNGRAEHLLKFFTRGRPLKIVQAESATLSVTIVPATAYTALGVLVCVLGRGRGDCDRIKGSSCDHILILLNHKTAKWTRSFLVRAQAYRLTQTNI